MGFYFSEDAMIISKRQRMTRRKGKFYIVLLQMQCRAAIAEQRAADLCAVREELPPTPETTFLSTYATSME